MKNNTNYCFNNIILPYYKFIQNGDLYVLNIMKMKTHKVDKNKFLVIDRALSKNHPITPKILIELEEIGLLDYRKLQYYFQSNLKNHNRPKRKSFSKSAGNLPIRSISLNIAQVCNLNCIYCYGDEGRYTKNGFMDKKTAVQSIDWLLKNSQDLKKVSVLFFGGEPMMNNELIKFIVKYANQKAKRYKKIIRYGLTTNGTLLNDENITMLKTHKIKPLVSFDGPPEIQNKNRPFKNGDASYPIVRSNIKRLLDIMPTLKCRATIIPGDSFEEIKHELLSIGFVNYVIIKASSSLLMNYTEKPFELFHRNAMVNFVENEANKMLSLIKRRNSVNQSYMPILKRLSNLIYRKKRFYGCEAGRNSLGISIDGDIYPCHRFVGIQKMKMGTIWDERFDQNKYLYRTVNNLLECKKCWARFFCGGGCMYVNMAYSGSIDIPEKSCCDEFKFLVETSINLFHQLDESDIDYLKNKGFI